MGLADEFKYIKDFVGSKFLNKSITPTDNNFFYPVGSEYSGVDNANIGRLQMLNYFLTVPELYMTIAMKASMFSKMKLNVVSKSTGLPLPLTNPIQKLLQFPNFHQGQKEFLIQTKMFRELYGNEYLYELKGIGAKVGKQINSLNPVRLEIEPKVINTTKPNFTMFELPEFNYLYNTGAEDYPITSKDIIHINNPAMGGISFNDQITGLSPITTIAGALENIKGAYESRGMLIHNRGALGILSNAGKDGTGAAGYMDKKDKEQLQSDFSRYGLKQKQWSTIITNLSLSWQKMGTSPKELMLFEEIEADFQVVLGAYGLRRELFPSVKGATFDNQKEAEKAAYINTIIPESQEWVSALNNYFKLEGASYHIVADFNDLPIFDEDLKNRGLALKLNINALTEAFNNEGIDLATYQKEIKGLLE